MDVDFHEALFKLIRPLRWQTIPIVEQVRTPVAQGQLGDGKSGHQVSNYMVTDAPVSLESYKVETDVPGGGGVKASSRLLKY